MVHKNEGPDIHDARKQKLKDMLVKWYLREKKWPESVELMIEEEAKNEEKLNEAELGGGGGDEEDEGAGKKDKKEGDKKKKKEEGGKKEKGKKGKKGGKKEKGEKEEDQLDFYELTKTVNGLEENLAG